MTGLLARAGALFLVPAEAATVFAPPRSPAPLVGVLADEADLLVAAGAVAGGLRRECGGAVVVCVWRGAQEAPVCPPVPALPGATRVAAKLARRDLAARAAGALCVVDLPADAGDAAAAARTAGAAVEGAVVLALARRATDLDGLLAGANRLVLAVAPGWDPVLAELAAEDLAQLGPPVTRTAVPGGMLARQAARLGLAVPPAPEPAEVPA